MKKVLAILLILVMTAAGSGALAEGGQAAGKVAIYSSMYPFVLEMLDEALRQEFPGLTPGGENGSFFIYDGTSSLIKRIYAGMKEGRLECDMMLVAEPSLSLELKEKDYLKPVEIPGIAEKLRFLCDPEGYWYPVRVCNMVLAYNPEMEQEWRAKGIQIPRTFENFAADRTLKGLISMGDPMTSGTTFASVAALTSRYGRQFLKGLSRNEVQVESGSRAIAKLQDGRIAAAMILEESVLKAQKDAADAGSSLTSLACIYPEDGAVLIPSTVMIVSEEHSPNASSAACEEIEKWFLTEKAQQMIMQGFMHSVLKEIQEGPWNSKKTDELKEKMMDVKWESVYKNRAELTYAWQDIVYSYSW